MDDKTRILICLGAATAENCVPCFEHYLGKATSAGITSEEVQGAVDLAVQVKKGAQMTTNRSIRDMMGPGRALGPDCCSREPENFCCE